MYLFTPMMLTILTCLHINQPELFTAPGYTEPETIIFVGDSRTVGMENSIDTENDNEYYIAKVGQGYKWLKDTAGPELEKTISEHGAEDINVVFNFGVNDLGNVTKYADYVNAVVEEAPDNVTFYYMSVNPVSDYPTVSNSSINEFNTTLKSSLSEDIGWIDTNTYMQENGFNTSDGLHYTSTTYMDIYNYVKEYIS